MRDHATHGSKHLKSARCTVIQKLIKSEWQKSWQHGKEDAHQLRNISRRPNVKHGAKLYQEIGNRKHIAWISRLRTGHCSLNKYLARFNIIEDPTCECGEAAETVAHFLLKCGLYDKERDRLRRKVGAQGMRIEKLLGDIECIHVTIEFIKGTGRFKF